MLGKLAVGEIVVGEVVTGEMVLWKLRWGNDLTPFFSLPVIYNVVYYSPDTQDILQISSLRLNIPR